MPLLGRSLQRARLRRIFLLPQSFVTTFPGSLDRSMPYDDLESGPHFGVTDSWRPPAKEVHAILPRRKS